jgi:transposase
VEQGLKISEIAERVGAKYATVRDAPKIIGLKVETQRQTKTQEEWIAKLTPLVEQGLTIEQIAEEVGAPYVSVSKKLKKLGLKARRRNAARNHTPKIADAILDGAGTLEAIGQKIGVSGERVRQILEKNGTSIEGIQRRNGIFQENIIIEENSQLITSLAGEGKNEEILTTDSEQNKVINLVPSLGLNANAKPNGPRFLLACVAVIYSKAEDIHAVAYPRVIYITRKNTTAVVENIAASEDKVTMTSIAKKLIGDEGNNLKAKRVNLSFTTKALCELFGIRKAGEVAKTGTGEGNNWNALTTFLPEQKPEGMTPEDYAEKVWRYAVSKEVLKANLRPLLKIARLQRDRTSAYQRLAELLKSPLKGDLDAQEKRAERFIRVCKTRVEKISARKAVQKEATDPTEAVKTSEAAISA